MKSQTVGFIGLGIMGRPMAKNLLKAGYPLVVHSRSRGPVQDLVGAGAKAATSPGGRRAGRRAHHHAAELARRRTGGAGPGRHPRGRAERTPLRRHVHDLSTRLAEGGEGPGRQGRTRARRAGVGRREGGHRRGAQHHGGRRQGRLRGRLADLPGHGQDHHPSGPARRGRLHQAREPDHRGGEPHRARRGPHARAQGRTRPRAHPQGARGRARRLQVPRAEGAQLHRRHLQARLQDRPPLQGPGPHHGVLARAGGAAARHRGGAGALQRDAREGQGWARSLRRDHPARGARGVAGPE